MAGLKRNQVQSEIDDFLNGWNQVASFISTIVSNGNPSMEQEIEFFKLTGYLSRKSSYLASQLNWGTQFKDKISDFLHDVYNLRCLIGQEEFQITLLREKWNAVQLEVNQLAVK